MKPAPDDLQSLCERGQSELIGMNYLAAEATLELAEAIALRTPDWDALSRLYMPLQETRRQKRQRCGEGAIKLDLLADANHDVSAEQALADFPQGQLLIAGRGTIAPAVEFRRLARERHMFAETFLAAVYPITGGARAVAIVPTDEIALPPPAERSIDQLLALLPPHSFVMNAEELPAGSRVGDAETYAYTMSLWERLHQPFLAQADATADPIARIAAYRRAIAVDYACELAHQKLSNTARQLTRAHQ